MISFSLSNALSKFQNLTIPSNGNIKTIGVKAYWDSTCKNETQKIEWGAIFAHSSKNYTLYVCSMSNVPTVLQFNTSNLSPDYLSDYLVLSCDCNGVQLEPGQTIKLSLFLSVAMDDSLSSYLITNPIINFNMDIYFSTIPVV